MLTALQTNRSSIRLGKENNNYYLVNFLCSVFRSLGMRREKFAAEGPHVGQRDLGAHKIVLVRAVIVTWEASAE